ncbi:phage integrase family protein [Sphingomonas sp. PP-F2F-A104-K0414]|uniref:tyrosine-type recombinase/integrase n=1 Tax=Sphingomonas sp. PP-F2F-A104-K0414 TaxID=2135661 RepID=UPI001043286B|nr:tyrosine-type recombinase/integrase [Sphingomonas sp. PP-F2F-A104-K0414]TCP98148.1 phage integrase family protein [Sphingomonas sp. PP-F2F-A104-K0414]
MSIVLRITDAGRAALVNAARDGTNAVRIASVGVAPTAIVAAANTAALPGEVKRIATISGAGVAADVIHLIVRDESADTYTVRSLALYLTDGTLFASYGQAAPIIEKSAGALLLLAIDATLLDVAANQITFGNTSFLNPPATTSTPGVVALATDAEAIVTRPFKVSGGGFHSWTEEEIAAFERRHPIGTVARLAFDLMIWTGQRGGDARKMGPASVRDTRLELTQEKTKVFVSLPIMPGLAESILATPTVGAIFVVTEFGKQFSVKGFGNKFRQWCDEAGLPNCSAHGLRKAAARRFAEAGCSNQEIKAWTGHTTDSEVARYTAAADQRTLSDTAADKLLANLAERLAKDAAKALKSGENK